MKIFYLGHFFGYDGHSRAARDFVELLLNNGHSVVCRSIDNNSNMKAFDPKWERLCTAKAAGTFDIAIVHKTPWNQQGQKELLHLSEPIASAKKKVFLTVFETTKWPIEWKEPLESFDSIITFSEWQGRAARELLPYKPIFVVPHVVEPSKEIAEKNPELYRFYSEFSDITDRKGLDVLLKAYYLAFDHSDKVELFIKLPNKNDAITKFYEMNKKAQACFTYKAMPKRLSIATAYLPDDELDRLMLTANAYVCPARGEGFSLPLARAAVNGLACLYPRTKELVSDLETSWGNDYFEDACSGYNANLVSVISDTFTTYGFQFDTRGMKWLEPDIEHLAKRMKEYYEIGSIDSPDYSIDRLSSKSVYSKLMEALS